MEKISPKAIWLFFYRFLFVGTVFFLFIFLSLSFLLGSWWRVLDYLKWLVTFFSFYLVFSYLWAELTYQSWGYKLTENTVQRKGGVILKEHIIIPYNQIKSIAIKQGPVSQFFNLATIQIKTSAYSSLAWDREGSLHISDIDFLPGLEPESAEKLKDEILERIVSLHQKEIKKETII